MAPLKSVRISFIHSQSSNSTNRFIAADFGFAAQLTPEIRTRNEVLGTCCWMAPEIVKGQEYGVKVSFLFYPLHSSIFIFSSSLPSPSPSLRQIFGVWVLLHRNWWMGSLPTTRIHQNKYLCLLQRKEEEISKILMHCPLPLKIL